MISVIDYGAGNLTSVRQALSALGATFSTPATPADLRAATGIVVPGVGHFERTRAIDDEWRAAIRTAVSRGVPVLGICLGLQWLFDGSDEAPGLAGLGVFPGTVTRLPEDAARRDALLRLRVPHVGWSRLTSARSGLLAGVRTGTFAYFTHSYAAPLVDETTAVAVHGVPFTAVAERGAVAGVQFHPERSGAEGRRLLANWLALVRREKEGQAFLSVPAVDPKDLATRSAEMATRNGKKGQASFSGLARRIVACLDVRDDSVVKGVHFSGLRDAGDPAALAARYDAAGIDELVVLDVTATVESRQTRAMTVAAVAERLSIPLTVGGGIRSTDDAAAVIEAGADKVSLNSAALDRPALISELARRYGSQAVIVAIDARQQEARYAVYGRAGRDDTGRSLVEWAEEAVDRGAGEILLTSIDADGTRAGFDCPMTAAVAGRVDVPVIASGGAGTRDHFADVFATGGADAALAASIFHFGVQDVAALKAWLAGRGIPVRPVPGAAPAAGIEQTETTPHGRERRVPC